MAKWLFKDGKLQFDNSKIQFTQAGDDPDDCACCGFSCPSGDPHLEVTISWTSDPTGNTGWGATNPGELDMFGETWASSGLTKNICPDTYHHGQHSTKTTYSTAQWVYGGGGGGNIGFFNQISSGYLIPITENVTTRDADRFKWVGIATSFSSVWNFSANTYHNNAASITGAETGVTTADITPGTSFAQFDGSFKATSDGITIQWQKSAAFP